MARTTLQLIARQGALGSVDSGTSSRSGDARYATELTKALVATAPPGCDVVLVERSHPAAWAAGVHRGPSSGLVHSPGLAAPLWAHDRRADRFQVTVTVHDALAWTHPSSIPPARLAWVRAMTGRAARFADAVVVPTHAVAETLGDRLDFGERLRVIPGAVAPTLALPPDAAERAARLALPADYVLALGSLERRKATRDLIEAVASPGLDGVPLVLVGESAEAGSQLAVTAMELGLPEGRVRVLGQVSDADLAVLFANASVFVAPSRAEGFGLSVLEAFGVGAPVVLSDAPALVEVSSGAGLVVPREESGSRYSDRIAAAIARVLGDREFAAHLSLAGRDRAKAFSWSDSARALWQLHADL